MSVDNPYFHRGPIRQPDYFFGRDQEVTSVLSLIKNNQSVSIVGPRRIGKTSFLLHISHPEVMARHSLAPEKHVFVFIDCGGLSDLNQSGFFRLILEETQDQLLDQGLEAELRIPETLSYRQFERILRRLSRQGLKLIYLLDEFELISDNHNLDADFFSGLRGLTARHNVCYVTASQAHLLKLSYADDGVLGSPFFNIFAVQYLNLLDQSEALQLIQRSSNAAGVTFPEETVDYILNLVGTHPLFLNIGCFHMFSQLKLEDTSTNNTASNFQETERKILAEVEGHLHYYWSKLDTREKETLVTLKLDRRGDTTQVLINHLEQQGLVIRANGSYRHSSRALTDFVQRQATEESQEMLVADPAKTLVGCRLGQYVITEQVGQGGMAQVYKGRHEALNRDVAIKIISAHLADDQDFLARFRREAQAVAALRHPHIVQIYDFGFQDNLYYMVMEYVTGGTLKDRLVQVQTAGYAPSLAEITQLVYQVATALDYAHAQGIIHRDLKPANIMLTAEGQAVLADFGLARLMGNTRHTATGATFGTPAYMSPEQAQGEQGDERSDIYAVGVILYELVTGQIPFEADNPFGLLMMHLNEPAPPPRSQNPQLPEAVEQVILKALAKAPQARYQTAGELAQALSSAVASGVQSSADAAISAVITWGD